MSRQAHQPNRGRSDDWVTPRELVAALGAFDLDPCVPGSMPWATAARMLTRDDDGLASAWQGRVWLNPPYGPEAARWLERLAHHGNGIALIFARTETAWFFEQVWKKASALLFLRGRLHFCRPDGKRARGNAGGPSVLVAYDNEDSRNALCLLESRLEGQFVDLTPILDATEEFKP